MNQNLGVQKVVKSFSKIRNMKYELLSEQLLFTSFLLLDHTRRVYSYCMCRDHGQHDANSRYHVRDMDSMDAHHENTTKKVFEGFTLCSDYSVAPSPVNSSQPISSSHIHLMLAKFTLCSNLGSIKSSPFAGPPPSSLVMEKNLVLVMGLRRRNQTSLLMCTTL